MLFDIYQYQILIIEHISLLVSSVISRQSLCNVCFYKISITKSESTVACVHLTRNKPSLKAKSPAKG